MDWAASNEMLGSETLNFVNNAFVTDFPLYQTWNLRQSTCTADCPISMLEKAPILFPILQRAGYQIENP